MNKFLDKAKSLGSFLVIFFDFAIPVFEVSVKHLFVKSAGRNCQLNNFRLDCTKIGD